LAPAIETVASEHSEPGMLARLFSELAQLGQPVVVDKVPGARANSGADRVAKSPPGVVKDSGAKTQ
jgi:tripartite-type tricarboxylate transporter receptor subunit TctC